MANRIFINGEEFSFRGPNVNQANELHITPDLPTIPEMIKVVRWYIHKVTGQVINPVINMNNESKELNLLEWIYRQAMKQLI